MMKNINVPIVYVKKSYTVILTSFESCGGKKINIGLQLKFFKVIKSLYNNGKCIKYDGVLNVYFTIILV